MNNNVLGIAALALVLGIIGGGMISPSGQPQASDLSNSHRMPDGTMMQNAPSMQGMMMDMTSMLRGRSGADLEKAFLTEMVPHHQGAIDMAKLILEDPTSRPELKAFAQDIITAQTSEIQTMQNWLKEY